MSKKHGYYSLLIALVAVWDLLGGNMKLVNHKTGFVLLEFVDEKPVFFDKYLEEALTHEGIIIPPAFKKSFKGKSVIRVEDKDFYKAFTKVYYPMSMNKMIFVWEKA